MNWLNPSALYLLLLIPPVIILYFMKLRRKKYFVTASFLWKKVMQDARVDSFFQKLKVNILLILQILFILFVIAALLRPYFKSLGTLSAETIFIIDTSASMNTLEGNKSRLSLAKEKIREFLDQARSGSSFMLISSDDRAKILSGFTTDKSKVNKLIGDIQPTDRRTDLKPAILLAISLLKTHKNAEIFLVGDKMPDYGDLNLKDLPAFHFISVGKNQNNVAITSCDVSRLSRKGPSDLFVKVENFSLESVNTFLEISFNDVLREAREISLEPGISKSFIFKVPADFSGLIKAELPLKDSLSSDNTAWIRVGSPGDVKVLLVSDENPFLQKVLSLLPGVSVEMINDSNLKNLKLETYNVIVWNNSKVPSSISSKSNSSKGNHLFINCNFESGDIKTSGIIDYPSVMSWESTHPVFRFVNLTDLAISQSSEVKPPPGARMLVEGDTCPLIFLVEKKNFRGIYILFDLFKSDWQLLPSFPIFMANAIDFLNQQGGITSANHYKTGETVPLDFIKPEDKISIKNPGNIKSENLNKTGKTPRLSLNRAGLYSIKAGKRNFTIPVNLLNREESDIKPDSSSKLKKSESDRRTTYSLIREIWWELAMVALLLVMLEWYIFNRRRV